MHGVQTISNCVNTPNKVNERAKKSMQCESFRVSLFSFDLSCSRFFSLFLLIAKMLLWVGRDAKNVCKCRVFCGQLTMFRRRTMQATRRCTTESKRLQFVFCSFLFHFLSFFFAFHFRWIFFASFASVRCRRSRHRSKRSAFAALQIYLFDGQSKWRKRQVWHHFHQNKIFFSFVFRIQFIFLRCLFSVTFSCSFRFGFLCRQFSLFSFALLLLQLMNVKRTQKVEKRNQSFFSFSSIHRSKFKEYFIFLCPKIKRRSDKCDGREEIREKQQK